MENVRVSFLLLNQFYCGVAATNWIDQGSFFPFFKQETSCWLERFLLLLFLDICVHAMLGFRFGIFLFWDKIIQHKLQFPPLYPRLIDVSLRCRRKNNFAKYHYFRWWTGSAGCVNNFLLHTQTWILHCWEKFRIRVISANSNILQRTLSRLYFES